MNRQSIRTRYCGFFILAGVALLLTGSPAPALAAPVAGQVAAVSGEVTAAGGDGAIRSLAVNAPVFTGDIISTGPNSKVRLLFSDNSVIFLRPSSRFVIEAYQHSGNAAKDESVFSLVRGGFRAVTGAIGQVNKDNVRIETPSATIGIRGTDHEGRLCLGDCFDLADIGVSAPPDGLYTGTNVGETQVGGQPFRAGQYGFTTPDRVTILLAEPPPILVADPDLQGALAMQEEEKGEQREEEVPPEETKTEEKAQEEQPQEEKAQEEKGQEESAREEQKAEPQEEEQKPAAAAREEQKTEPTQEAKPAEQPEAGQPEPEPTAQTGPPEAGPAPGRAAPTESALPESPPSTPAPGQPVAPVAPVASEMIFEIPAQPPTVRAIQCR